MKTLLIGINSKYIHPNLAIRLLKANCFFPVDIKEFNIKHTVLDIYNYIIENNYLIVGISCYIWNIELVKELLPLIRKHNITVILGGPEVSYNSKYYLENNLADYVLKNEGEESFDLLIKYLHKEIDDISIIPNLYYQDKFTFDKLVDISKIKMAYDLLDDVTNQIIYIETSRGCPFHCGYCMASLDNKLRFFSIDEIKRQVLALIEKGGKVFKFLDRTFNANKKNFLSLIDFIIKNHKPGNSFQFEITGDLLDDDIIQYINEHAPKDLFRFEIGIQSTNLKANKAVYRIQNNEKLFHNIKLIQDKGIIDLHLDLIAGLPYEDYPSFINTFNEVLSLRPKELQLGFLKLLKGTKLYDEKELYGYKFNKNAPYDIISNNFLSKEDIYNIHIVEDAFDYYYNKDYFKISINFILDNISDSFSFFYNLGKIESKSKKLEHTFRTLDDFIKNKYSFIYDSFHELLIIDYLNCYSIKPGSWWDETISPKEKNETLRYYHQKELESINLNIFYKYALVIPLKNSIIIAIYINNSRTIYKIKRR